MLEILATHMAGVIQDVIVLLVQDTYNAPYPDWAWSTGSINIRIQRKNLD